MNVTRKVEVLKGDAFEEIPFEKLKPGDTFRMTEPTGEPVLWSGEEGETGFFRAAGDPFLLNGVWTIKVSPLKLVAGEMDKLEATL